MNDNESVLDLLNSAPLFWGTNLGALQTATFVTLGRIFDKKSTHNLGRLLKLAQDNPDIFSKVALGRRKQGTDKSPPDWLTEYLQRAYVPKPSDFRRLRAHVSKCRKIYKSTGLSVTACPQRNLGSRCHLRHVCEDKHSGASAHVDIFELAV
jgi:hypothetical protein